jgi:hypothetical protein
MHIIIFATIIGVLGLLQFAAAFLSLPPSLNKWFFSGGRRMRALLSHVPAQHQERVSRIVVGGLCVAISVSTLATRLL